MIRGTTPTFIINVHGDFDLLEANNVYVTFEQECYKITKTGDDLEVYEHQINVYMSQSETLKFKTGQVDIQVNWTYGDGNRASSNIANIYVDRNLIGEVLP